MTTSYFVRYDPDESLSEAFLDHYRNEHSKILQQFPGIRALHLHTPADWQDRNNVNAGTTGLLAQMVFADTQTLNEALQSEARQLARRDFERFPNYSARVIHQAMQCETLFGDD